MSEQLKTVRMMGTVIDILIDTLDDQNSELIIEDTIRKLDVYEKRFSANDPKSELMAVNKAAGISPVSVHPDLYQLIKKGKAHSLAESSHLNIALGPLIKAWRIGFDDARKPTETEISEALQLTDPNLIHLNDERQSVYLEKKGMQIDLGALAKGYIADLIINGLKKEPIKSAYINLGGNFVSTGFSHKRASGCYRIGIQDPARPRGNYLLAVDTLNQSVVTSGIYERTLKHEGETFHHIFDTQTGYPTETDLASLTIISPESVNGEIWTTRLFGHSPSKILSTVEALPDIDCILITKSNTVMYSNGLEGKIIPLSPGN